MKAAIRERARELGFDDCRFTTAEPPASGAQFRQWLALGRHGQMAYLERNAEKRTEPQRVLPGARTIIALAASYGGPESDVDTPAPASGGPAIARPHAQEAADYRPRGIVARYARYSDYHLVLAERLKHLTEFLAKLSGEGTRSLWYVDTGPVLERDLAQRAGVGFIGKHTNLISRRFVFLRMDWVDAFDPARPTPTDGQPHLRLRRLPGRLPLEPLRPRRATDEGARPARPGRARVD